MSARTTHQSDPGPARLRREVEKIRRDLQSNATTLEARVAELERYLRRDLFPWLELVEATVLTGTDPPEPNFG